MKKKKRHKSTVTAGRLGRVFIISRINPGGELMDLQEFREAKWRLESQISDLLINFEHQTGSTILDMVFYHTNEDDIPASIPWASLRIEP